MTTIVELASDTVAVTNEGDVLSPYDFDELPPMNEELIEGVSSEIRLSIDWTIFLGKSGFDLAKLVNSGKLAKNQARDISDAIMAYQMAERYRDDAMNVNKSGAKKQELQQKATRARKFGDGILQSYGVEIDHEENSLIVSLRKTFRERKIPSDEAKRGSEHWASQYPDWMEHQLPNGDRD